jgi:hypothetical protein
MQKTHLCKQDEKQAKAKNCVFYSFLLIEFFESFHFAILEPTRTPEPVLQPANSRSQHPGT